MAEGAYLVSRDELGRYKLREVILPLDGGSNPRHFLGRWKEELDKNGEEVIVEGLYVGTSPILQDEMTAVSKFVRIARARDEFDVAGLQARLIEITGE